MLQPDFPTPRIEAAVQRLAAGLDVPADLMPPGPIITPPDRLDPADRIPYPALLQTDRTPAGPLQQLEAIAASQLGIDRRQLISRAGDIRQHGAAALFQRLPELGDTEPDGWVVAGHRTGEPKARLALRVTEQAAQLSYTGMLAWLEG